MACVCLHESAPPRPRLKVSPHPCGPCSCVCALRSPAISMPNGTPSPVHPPLSRNLSPDVSSVQDSLAAMSLPHVSSQTGVDEMDRSRMPGSAGGHGGVGVGADPAPQVGVCVGCVLAWLRTWACVWGEQARIRRCA